MVGVLVAFGQEGEHVRHCSRATASGIPLEASRYAFDVCQLKAHVSTCQGNGSLSRGECLGWNWYIRTDFTRTRTISCNIELPSNSDFSAARSYCFPSFAPLLYFFWQIGFSQNFLSDLNVDVLGQLRKYVLGRGFLWWNFLFTELREHLILYCVNLVHKIFYI